MINFVASLMLKCLTAAVSLSHYCHLLLFMKVLFSILFINSSQRVHTSTNSRLLLHFPMLRVAFHKSVTKRHNYVNFQNFKNSKKCTFCALFNLAHILKLMWRQVYSQSVQYFTYEYSFTTIASYQENEHIQQWNLLECQASIFSCSTICPNLFQHLSSL